MVRRNLPRCSFFASQGGPAVAEHYGCGTQPQRRLVASSDQSQTPKNSRNGRYLCQPPRKSPKGQSGGQGQAREPSCAAISHVLWTWPHAMLARWTRYLRRSWRSLWRRPPLSTAMSMNEFRRLAASACWSARPSTSILRRSAPADIAHARPGHGPAEPDWTVELTEWHLVGPRLASFLTALSRIWAAPTGASKNFSTIG